MDRLRNILVGIDFSPCSAAALKQAVHLAAATRATVTAMSVVPIPVYAVPDAMIIPFEFPSLDLLLVDARERWTRWEPAREVGQGVEFKAVVGSPREELIERSRTDQCDLLVVGAHSDDDARKGIGSIAAGCVQRAQTKVLVVRERAPESFTSVVACIDFTEVSKLVLEQAIRIAAQDNAALHILHVYEDPWAGLGPPAAIRHNMPDIARRYQDAILERLRTFCTDASHETGALKASFHAIQSEGHGRGVVDFVTKNSCDLAVLGTQSKWNIRDFVMGTTAQRIVREAPCSVLAVKPAIPPHS